jgi:hypothetical protein
MKSLISKRLSAETDKDRLAFNDSLIVQMRAFFEIPTSFNFPLDSLKTIGRIYSPDKSFRAITWNLQMEKGEHHHFGFIQMAKSKNDKKYFELKEQTSNIKNPEGSVLSASKWFGGLYYKILKNKIDNKVYYTLLALQYNDLFVSRKFIDVLYFDEYGNPVFGAPILQFGPKTTKLRMVMEYAASVSVSLRYDDERKMIIYDHLSPFEAKYTGLYQYYGPDLSFDAMVFENKKWNYVANVDSRRPRNEKPPKLVKRQAKDIR